MSRIVLAIFLACFITTSYSQVDRNYVQFIVSDITSSQQASQLDSAFKAESSVAMVRIDHLSKNATLIFVPFSEMSQPEIKSVVQSMGHTLSCFHSGVVGVDPMLRLKLSDCVLEENEGK